jgi:hypothetical protein
VRAAQPNVDNGACLKLTHSARAHLCFPHGMVGDEHGPRDRLVVLIVVLIIVAAATLAVLLLISTNFS